VPSGSGCLGLRRVLVYCEWCAASLTAAALLRTLVGITLFRPDPAWLATSGAARARHVDSLAVLGLCTLAGVAAWQLLHTGTIIGMDTATAFYPWYTFLGAGLRSGHIPLWNPHQFAGTPFAADPESGWAYLPAMLLFTFLAPTPAFNAFVVVHLMLAALGVYALARVIGMPPAGGAVASTAYVYSGFFFGHSVCCFAYSNVATWLPFALLGVERAVRSATWRSRVLAWSLAGLAISQILAAWLGQGAYYSLLVIGAYIAYRTLLSRATCDRHRLASFVMHASAVLLVGTAMAAAGLLPRFEYNALSNLPGGYPAADSAPAAASLLDWGVIEDWDSRLLTPGFHYVGGATLALALSAPLVAGNRFGVPFFAALAAAAVVLARWAPTPLHTLLGLLPAFGPMHAHAPERMLIVFFIAPALLAGATVSCFDLRDRKRVLAAGVFLAILAWLLHGDAQLAPSTVYVFVAATAVILVSVVMPRRVAAILAIALVFADLRIAWQTQLAASLIADGAYELKYVDLDAYYAPTPAGQFLRSATASNFARFVGYAEHVSGGPMPYTLRWSDPATVALQVDNRALVSELYDIQGYNPIHLARYGAYVDAMNGAQQDYHQTDVFAAGLNSPLLDLLGVRYIIVPAAPAADEVQPRFERPLGMVYQDANVIVLENDAVLPRVWIVHSAEQVTADQALTLLGTQAVDPRRTVLLEEPPPPLARAPTGSEEGAAIIDYAADRVRIHVQAATQGLLLLSDAFDPAWQVWIDDAAGHVYVADGVLRAVPVAEGEHTVEFRYRSPALATGLAITLATSLVVAAGVAVRRRQ
jgi:hypothetical protein